MRHLILCTENGEVAERMTMEARQYGDEARRGAEKLKGGDTKSTRSTKLVFMGHQKVSLQAPWIDELAATAIVHYKMEQKNAISYVSIYVAALYRNWYRN